MAETQRLFGWVPKSLCQALTLDNGTENASHEFIAQDKDMDVYFAHPHAPWLRGAKEQVNCSFVATSPRAPTSVK